MEQEPAVSVIILGYNGRDYLDDCFASVLDQDFDLPYEVLFVDNASTDGSAELAARYAGVRVHRMARNLGYSNGNNAAADLARAPLLVFLNQDTVVHRGWLRELTQAFASDPSVKAAVACIVHPWNKEYARRERHAPLRHAYTAELSRLGFVEYRRISNAERWRDTLFLSGVSLMLAREAIPGIGGYIFDPDMFMYGEDVDLSLRIRGAGMRGVVATRAIVYHAHQLSDRPGLAALSKTVRIIRNRLLAVWKNSDWLEFLPLAALLLAGSPLNATQFGLPAYKKVLYSILLVPPTLLAAAAALLSMPRFAGRRRDILQGRRLPRGWLLSAMVLRRSPGGRHGLAGREAHERA